MIQLAATNATTSRSKPAIEVLNATKVVETYISSQFFYSVGTSSSFSIIQLSYYSISSQSNVIRMLNSPGYLYLNSDH